MKKIYLIPILVIIAGCIWFVASGHLSGKYSAGITNPNPIACTQEAKLCPDGSAVGRTGPNCEFALCPEIKMETTANIGQRISNAGVYITPIGVVSDSRCPAEVQCFWAGVITVKVRLEKGTVIKEMEFNEGSSATFEGNNVSLVGVIPEKKTKTPLTDKDYQFIFKVVPANSSGTVTGTVSLGPTCPVERTPPDPACAPKPYATSIDIMDTINNQIIKTIQTDASGVFSVDLDPGSYVLQARGGNVLPRCGQVSAVVTSGQSTKADISCDTGIR